MRHFFETAAMQNHPMRVLMTFMEREEANEKAKKYEDMRFVGYVLDIGYDTLTIITSDPFKIAVGGIPRNSLLIMAPAKFDLLPLHFTLLRVLESAPTPLSQEVQQTYFELQKKSMPELDVFTQSELQWGALKTAVLGMFYPHPEKLDQIEFSGDLNNFVSAHKYRVYAPCDDLLNLIVNTLVRPEGRFKIGDLRLTECRLPLPGKPGPKVDVNVSTVDFMGCRTAMFGKTRLGKSNVVKLITQSLIETQPNVGQLIFDINGEYANDNPQDNNRSIASAYRARCEVYALTQKSATPSRPLKLNFYECPESSLRILGSLLRQHGRQSAYIESFASVELPSIQEIDALPVGGDKNRAIRKLQIYWAVLKRAGFDVDETKLRRMAPSSGRTTGFNPTFNAQLRTDAYQYANAVAPANINTLDDLVAELATMNRFRRDNPANPSLITGNNNPVFQPDDIALLEFLEPQAGRAGTAMIQPFRMYHDRNAGDFVLEILQHLDAGKTVILDLGNANPDVMWNPAARRQLPDFECPHCHYPNATLTYDADTGPCYNCGKQMLLTDMLGFHQEMAEDSAPDTVASSYMAIHETLMLFTGIRYFWEGNRNIIKNCLFIKDGPLSIRAQYSKLVGPIRQFLEHAHASGCPVHIIGQEKTGTFYDHLTLIRDHAPYPAYFIPDDSYIKQRIQNRPNQGAPYGLDTNYGAKVFLKLNPYHSMVINVPTGPHKPNPTRTDLIGFDRILATLPSILSNRYEGALMPVEMANGVASLSTYPSAKVLKMFAERTL